MVRGVIPPQLVRYWTKGEGAIRIRWGEPNDFYRCRRNLAEEGVDAKYLDGECARLHKIALGVWPGQEDGGKSAHDAEGLQALVAAIMAPRKDDPDYIGVRWRGKLAPIGRPTGDGRLFLPDRLDVSQRSMPLDWAKSRLGGHHGAVTVGGIDKVWEDNDADGRWLFAEGWYFKPEIIPEAAQAIALTKARVAGPSVDLDSYTAVSGQFEGRPVMAATRGRMRAATLVSIPAFTGLSLELLPQDVDKPVEAEQFASATGGRHWAGAPIAPREAEFSADQAVARIEHWAGLGSDQADPGKLAQMFLWVNTENKPLLGREGYRLPWGDIIDGKPYLIYHAIYAAAALLEGGHGGLPNIPDQDKAKIRSEISDIYARLAEHYGDPKMIAPWDADSERAQAEAAELAFYAFEDPDDPWCECEDSDCASCYLLDTGLFTAGQVDQFMATYLEEFRDTKGGHRQPRHPGVPGAARSRKVDNPHGGEFLDVPGRGPHGQIKVGGKWVYPPRKRGHKSSDHEPKHAKESGNEPGAKKEGEPRHYKGKRRVEDARKEERESQAKEPEKKAPEKKAPEPEPKPEAKKAPEPKKAAPAKKEPEAKPEEKPKAESKKIPVKVTPEQHRELSKMSPEERDAMVRDLARKEIARRAAAKKAEAKPETEAPQKEADAEEPKAGVAEKTARLDRAIETRKRMLAKMQQKRKDTSDAETQRALDFQIQLQSDDIDRMEGDKKRLGKPAPPQGKAIERGLISPKAAVPNQWGTGRGEIHYHRDGAIGQAVGGLGPDAALSVDGERLDTVLGRIATRTVSGAITPQEQLDELKALERRLPEGTRAKRAVRFAVEELSSDPVDIPPSVKDAPQPLQDLMSELAEIPVARGGARVGASDLKQSEVSKLDKLLQEWHAGKVSPRDLIDRVERDLHNNRHESIEGKMAIDRAVLRARDQLVEMDRKELLPPKMRERKKDLGVPGETPKERLARVEKGDFTPEERAEQKRVQAGIDKIEGKKVAQEAEAKADAAPEGMSEEQKAKNRRDFFGKHAFEGHPKEKAAWDKMSDEQKDAVVDEALRQETARRAAAKKAAPAKKASPDKGSGGTTAEDHVKALGEAKNVTEAAKYLEEQKLSNAQLKEVAQKQGYRVPSNATKADLQHLVARGAFRRGYHDTVMDTMRKSPAEKVRDLKAMSPDGLADYLKSRNDADLRQLHADVFPSGGKASADQVAAAPRAQLERSIREAIGNDGKKAEAPAARVTPKQHADYLRESGRTRDEANKELAGLSKADVVAVAAEMDVPHTKKATAEQIRQSIAAHVQSQRNHDAILKSPTTRPIPAPAKKQAPLATEDEQKQAQEMLEEQRGLKDRLATVQGHIDRDDEEGGSLSKSKREGLEDDKDRIQQRLDEIDARLDQLRRGDTKKAAPAKKTAPGDDLRARRDKITAEIGAMNDRLETDRTLTGKKRQDFNDRLDDLLSQAAELDEQIDTGVKTPPSRQIRSGGAKPGFDAKAVGSKLDAAGDREAGHKALEGLTSAQLREVAKDQDVPVTSKATKQQIANTIVELRVGRRVDSHAINPGTAKGAKKAAPKAGSPDGRMAKAERSVAEKRKALDEATSTLEAYKRPVGDANSADVLEGMKHETTLKRRQMQAQVAYDRAVAAQDRLLPPDQRKREQTYSGRGIDPYRRYGERFAPGGAAGAHPAAADESKSEKQWLAKAHGAAHGEDALDAVPAKLTAAEEGHSGDYSGEKLDAPEGSGSVRALSEMEGLEYQTTNSLLWRGKDPHERRVARSELTEDQRARMDRIDKETRDRIREVDKTMDHSPLSEDVVTYRGAKRASEMFGYGRYTGIDSDDFAEQDRQFERFQSGYRPDLTGMEWTQHSYLHTTVNDERLAGYAKNLSEQSDDPVAMTIVLPKGTGAVRMSGIGAEAEIMAERGLKLRVVADHGLDEHGVRHLDIEVVGRDAGPV